MRLYVQQNPFLNWILKRIQKKKNCMIVIVGQTGSGKSYAAMMLAIMLDALFNIDRIAFTGKEFIEIASNPKLKPGSVILLDEAGISMDNRTWWSTHNRMINWLLQTFRHQRLIAIITVPELSFIDKKSLVLFHVVMETTSIDPKKKICFLKPKIVNPKPASLTNKNFWMTFPTIKDDSGEVIKINRLEVGLPPKKLLKNYEKKKSEFTRDLKDDALMALGGGKIKKYNLDLDLSERKNQVLLLKQMGFRNVEIEKILEKTSSTIAEHVTKLRERGLLGG